MKTYTINEQNVILAFATAEETAVNSAAPFHTFTSADELVQLATAWPAEKLLAIWNGVDGLTPATAIKDPAKAAKVIFKRLEKSDAPVREQMPRVEKKAKGAAKSTKDAPAKGKATKKAPAAKSAPKTKKAAKKQEAGAPREGSKTAQVVAMLQHKNGATLAEIAEKMGWQNHTVRGFMAGAMKKAGYPVESFKPEGGERTYRLPGK
jgi:hypothetical protein